MRSTCSPSKNNVLLVTCFREKLLFSSCRRCFDRSSSIFTSSKCNKGRNGLFNGSLFGACYHSKRHKAIVAKDRITRKTCKLLVCQYAHCPRWDPAQSAKPQGRVSCGNPSLFRQWWHDRNPCKVSTTPLE